MHAEANVVTVLRACEGTLWTPRGPASLPAIGAAEKALGTRFPAEYQTLLLYSNGGALKAAQARVLFFSIEELPEFNVHRVWSPHLPGMVVFGDDFGDYIYYFDPENRLHRGDWAIYLVEKGGARFDYSKYAASSLDELCRRVIDGVALVDEPYLRRP